MITATTATTAITAKTTTAVKGKAVQVKSFLLQNSDNLFQIIFVYSMYRYLLSQSLIKKMGHFQKLAIDKKSPIFVLSS